MNRQPSIKTQRLVLRPFSLNDAPRVRELAGDIRIADVTANIPHPYHLDDAISWIQTHSESWDEKKAVCFALALEDSGLLIGAICLSNLEENSIEVGYWLGVDYWGEGFMPEACVAVIKFGFDHFPVNRIHAHHLSRNSASGNVLLKAGFSHIGSSKSVCGFRKEKEDTERYEILRYL